MSRIDEQRETQRNEAVQPGIGLHAAPGRAGCAFAPTRKFDRSGHVNNGRVGDYVWMPDSEFRRWARCGSNDFWRNSAAIFSNSLLHTALDFANGMIAEDTNPKEERSADEVGRSRPARASRGRWSPLHRADCVELRTTSWIPYVCVYISHTSLTLNNKFQTKMGGWGSQLQGGLPSLLTS